GFHRLRTRKAGNFRFVEFHMKVDPDMSVQESHRITEELARAIEWHFPSASVTIHTEPCDGDCVGNCLTGCLLTEEKRRDIMAGKKIAG
ncbi:MAG: cation transporter dimerization domain-containing protein, partial [Syntrophales bacterium]